MVHTALPHRMIVAALALALAVGATAQQSAKVEKKLYRWVDPSGKVHYTDALPSDVVDQARAELSATTGMVQSRIGRALTEAERRQLAAQLATAAEAQSRIDNSRRADEAKISSFRTELDLRAAYQERQSIIDDTVESLDAAVDSQRNSLHSQMGLAGDNELAGKPVPQRTITTISDLRKGLQDQEVALLQRAAEKQVLGEELDRLVVMYRDRQARGLAPQDPAPSVR